MKRILPFILLACGLMGGLRSYGQNPLTDRLARQYELWPQERLYIHTATDEYAPGDIVWLKVYIMDAQKFQNIDGSRYVYLELAGEDGSILTRRKIMARKGLYEGYIRVPDGLASGVYGLRAYTRYSQDTPWNTYCHPLQIGQSKALERTYSPSWNVVGTDSLLRARFHEDGSLVLSVPHSSYYLVGTCRMQPFFAGGISAGKDVAFIDLPDGVVTFYLLDASFRVVGCHSELIENGQRQCKVSISQNKKSYKKGATVKLTLDVGDLAEDEIADLSLSVCKNRHPLGDNIGCALLRSNPAFGLDMDRVFKGDYYSAPAAQEEAQVLEGSVRGAGRKKPVANATVRLIAPQVGQYALATTDSLGNFSFVGLDDPEGTTYVLSAINEKGNDNVVLSVKEPTFPPFPKNAFKVVEVSDTVNVEYGGIDMDEALELNAAYVKAEAPDVDMEVVSSLADFSFGPKKIEEMGATCLHEVLRRVPGVFMQDEKVYIRAITSIYGDNPAAIAINGVIMDEEFDLDDIIMQDVERVDVFKTGQTVIWGTAASSGLVSITTKNGYSVRYDPEEHLNMKNVALLGYQLKSIFEQDYRVMYWNPSVQSQTLEFTVPEIATSGLWRVVLEGITSKGRYIHEETQIRVQ